MLSPSTSCSNPTGIGSPGPREMQPPSAAPRELACPLEELDDRRDSQLQVPVHRWEYSDANRGPCPNTLRSAPWHPPRLHYWRFSASSGRPGCPKRSAGRSRERALPDAPITSLNLRRDSFSPHLVMLGAIAQYGVLQGDGIVLRG